MCYLWFIWLIILMIPNYLVTIRQVISEPGLYTLGSDIIYAPQTINDSIINIKANEVILDLGGYIISQDSNFLLSGLNGIVVDPNLSKVVIKNGMIANITGTGIFIGDGCSQIVLNNIITFSCDDLGIIALGSSANPIKQLNVEFCQTISCARNIVGGTASAMNFTECLDSRMFNCSVNENSNDSQFFSAFLLDSCSKCRLKNVIAKNNKGSGFIVMGITLFNGDDNLFQDCISLNNQHTTGTGDLFGFLISGGIFKRQNLMNCFALQNNGGNLTSGFFVDGPQQDILFLGCQSLQNSGTSQVFGFNADGQRNNFIHCIAKGNNTADVLTGTASGFSCNGVKCIFEECLAAEQSGGVGVGFDFDNTTSCEIKNCKAYLNTGTSDATSFGFRINGSSGLPDTGNNLFVDNVAANNGSIAANQMNNFMVGTFTNILYGSLNAVASPFTNLGVVP